MRNLLPLALIALSIALIASTESLAQKRPADNVISDSVRLRTVSLERSRALRGALTTLDSSMAIAPSEWTASVRSRLAAMQTDLERTMSGNPKVADLAKLNTQYLTLQTTLQTELRQIESKTKADTIKSNTVETRNEITKTFIRNMR